MKAKYDIPAIHAKCIEWCENPVFPYPWQVDQGWRLKECLMIVNRDNVWMAEITKTYPYSNYGPDRLFQFALFIGIDVESYRIKETYKSAVERYLSTIGEGQPLWEGSPFTKHTQLLAPPVIWASYLDAKYCFCLVGEYWSAQGWHTSYHFLRLDLNPDYQVEG